MHYYRHHIGDFLKDTGHLSNDQMGIYLRMLWKYYLDEKPLKDDCEGIAFAMRSDEKTVHLILRHFFVLADEGWRHKRCDKEIEEYHNKSEKAKNSASARWNNSNAMRTHTERNTDATKIDANHKPITNNHKPIKEIAIAICPINVDEQVWSDFLALRKVKKAPMTVTALAGIKREADKASWSLDKALSECVARGWTGFKADWVADKNLSKTGQMNQTVMSGLTRGLIGGGSNVKLLGN
ncbi:Protein of unknown function DUF1376 [uncultured Caudovirales phage]|uniref:DUF1376 domain-containing protein n=1 Tax=uncultured Caudovirales phage TaxID=2100421 RepID=A0A6J5MM80_9CAUD|nr:Protein of unknown function DUF1376 [uncultured Caudovirales phage]